MAFPTVFFNLAAGNQPASLLDTMYNIVGGMGAIPCTATGTNAITLASNTNYYAPAAYANYQTVIFRAVATSTGAVTVQLNGLAFVKLFMANLVQAGAGDIVSGSWYQAFFASQLDAGAGGFLINNSTTAASTQPLQGNFKNLVLTNTTAGTPNSQVVPTADQLILENTTGGTVKISTYAPPVTNITVGGANGLDTGAVAPSTWYAWWAIYNATTATAAGLFSASFTAPTMPAGYTYKGRFGAFRTDAASNLHRILIKGRQGQYVVSAAGTPTTLLPVITLGSTTSPAAAAPVWTAASVAGFVPPTASKITLATGVSASGAGTGAILVSPNANYGGTTTSGGNISLLNNNTGVLVGMPAIFILEATTIQVATSGGGSIISCVGWEDTI